MNSIRQELEETKRKYQALREEWELQQEHLGRLQRDSTKVQEKLQQQSAFCATLGSTLGNLLWKISRNPQVSDTIVNASKIGDFLTIVAGTLTSFVQTYKSELPGQGSDESQFVMALVGVVTNIAATPNGRDFLPVDENGRDVINQLAEVLQDIPIPSGNCLKRLILMALFNISINASGAAILQDKTLLWKVIGDILAEQNQEIQLMALKLLQSLTWNIPSQILYDSITESITKKTLEKFHYSTEDLSDAAKAVQTNLERASEKLHERNSGFVP